MTTGIDLIAAERQRQVDAEGFTPEHDAEHQRGDIAHAAACYVLLAARQQSNRNVYRTKYARGSFPFNLRNGLMWPWGHAWWKPSEDPLRNLEKAGALIAAEIDRILAREDELIKSQK